MKKGPADTPMAAGKNKRGKNGVRYEPEARAAHVKAFYASGLSQMAYSRKSKVSPMTLGKWLKADRRASGRAKDATGKFAPGAPVDLKEDDFFSRVKDEPLSIEEQNQRLRIAIKALARML